MSQGEVAKKVEIPVEVEPEPHSEEVKVEVTHAPVEVSDEGSKMEKVLADGDMSSVYVQYIYQG